MVVLSEQGVGLCRGHGTDEGGRRLMAAGQDPVELGSVAGEDPLERWAAFVTERTAARAHTGDLLGTVTGVRGGRNDTGVRAHQAVGVPVTVAAIDDVNGPVLGQELGDRWCGAELAAQPDKRCRGTTEVELDELLLPHLWSDAGSRPGLAEPHRDVGRFVFRHDARSKWAGAAGAGGLIVRWPGDW